jgi:hypothetical protein
MKERIKILISLFKKLLPNFGIYRCENEGVLVSATSQGYEKYKKTPICSASAVATILSTNRRIVSYKWGVPD